MRFPTEVAGERAIVMPLKVVLTPLGSAGDVHPHVWLAKLLAARGHDVVMVCQDIVAEIPRRAGVRTVTWGDKVEQELVLKKE